MTESCRTFSLDQVLMDYLFGAAIRIAYGDLNGGDGDSHDGVRSAVKSGGYCATKQLLSSNLSLEGAPAPTDASDLGSLKAH